MYLSFPFNPWVGAVLAVLSLPHLLYCFVWLRPSAFISFSKKLNMPALDVFYKVSFELSSGQRIEIPISLSCRRSVWPCWQISVGLKFVQFTALGIWGFKVSSLNVHFNTSL
jgi:hypothetical protein